MKRVVRCRCGVEIRGESEQEVIERVREHATSAHDLQLTDEQIVSMIEIESA